MPKLSSAWIFISYSNRDLEAVRRIRNEFEKLGANPILFFLKAMTQENKAELDTLIKREIAARKFFVLCDSKNAQASDWVRKEQDYVRSLPHKSIHEIDLAAAWEAQRRVILDALKAATVFASYAHADRDRVAPYFELLRQNDVSLWEPARGEANWTGGITQAVEEVTAAGGRCIAFLSGKALASPFVAGEIALFLKKFEAGESGAEPILALLERLRSPPPFRGIVVDLSGRSIAKTGPRLLRALGI
jgi:hypothetical protein